MNKMAAAAEDVDGLRNTAFTRQGRPGCSHGRAAGLLPSQPNVILQSIGHPPEGRSIAFDHVYHGWGNSSLYHLPWAPTAPRRYHAKIIIFGLTKHPGYYYHGTPRGILYGQGTRFTENEV